MPQKILVLFAHPAYRRSRLNRAMRAAVEPLDGVTLHDLYETYPDFAIDVDREQALVAEHDLLVVQHPFFWYSAPAIIKEWQDLVLELGWAYGRRGHALAGKGWMQAVTAGGRESAYAAEGVNRFSIEDLLRPFEATANLCQMTWHRPFIVHAAHMADTEEITDAAAAYRNRLIALRDGSPVRIAGAGRPVPHGG